MRYDRGHAAGRGCDVLLQHSQCQSLPA
jgi:hypothetical protein